MAKGDECRSGTNRIVRAAKWIRPNDPNPNMVPKNAHLRIRIAILHKRHETMFGGTGRSLL